MLAGQIAASGRSVVYLSAEESAAQVRARARRLDADRRGFFLLEQPVLEHVMPALYQDPPTLLVVDSIQSVLSQDVEGVAGGVSQIRMCGSLLADFARGTGCAVVVIGHVTKEGELAGPRLLEHLVDTVLYFEPDAEGSVRIIRAFKNRFGRTGELVVLEMGESGLSPVRDASALFLAGRQKGEPGSCVSAILSGTRPLLVELQALLVRSQYAAPTRVVTGLDSKRVAQLAAILASKGRIESLGHDVYVKVAGGLYVTDPGTDLGLVLAMTSSLKALELPADLLAVGEVGLTGELRAVPQLGARLEEAQAHGFQRAVVASHEPRRLPRLSDMQIAAVANVREALGATFGRERSLRRAEGS
jgi:DNA repair protein RadA/Sms